jgi:hypothetical protein
MDVWERHAQRLRRQKELAQIERWCTAHPYQGYLLGCGFGLAVLVASQGVKLALDAFGNWLAR